MRIPNILAEYQNGNTYVILESDGTKTRSFRSYVTPTPVHPDSIDLKITDWCDANCEYCHESSTVRGRHADIDTIKRIVSSLPPGVEIAIGGGDPFSHPQISDILKHFANYGLISNVTVNGQHIERSRDKILGYRKDRLIYGLGISYHPLMYCEAYYEIWNADTILHVIAGEMHPLELPFNCNTEKILVLGYKNHGRGIWHGKQQTTRIDLNLSAWRYWLPDILNTRNVAFDNLALEQLRVKDIIPGYLWKERYQGSDGQFTMYADAVTDTFARSSTSVRKPFNNRSIIDCFAEIRKENQFNILT